MCDAGYTNGPGFLAPYRGQRYHLNDWKNPPTTTKEFFNMKHSHARNCIERCFGILKQRFGILRDQSFYPPKTLARIISACCILHNFIRGEMPEDPIEDEYNMLHSVIDVDEDDEETDLIRSCEPTTEWTQWRDNLAEEMFNKWLLSRNENV